MTTWEFVWNLAIRVDQEKIASMPREDLILAIRAKLDDLNSYCDLIGVTVTNKAVNENNPDLNGNV